MRFTIVLLTLLWAHPGRAQSTTVDQKALQLLLDHEDRFKTYFQLNAGLEKHISDLQTQINELKLEIQILKVKTTKPKTRRHRHRKQRRRK